MSALQKEVIQSLNGMSDETVVCRLGIFKHECLYEEDYDIDEYNPEIARMFGVNV